MRRHLRLLLNVSFDGQSRHNPGNPPYYLDHELVGVVMDELASVAHNEDRPRTTLLASKITRVSDDEWDPKPGTPIAGEAVSSEELASLRKDSNRLAALEAAGVDNWEGYDEAMQSAGR